MDKEKPRLARLTAILTQLQSSGLVTAKNIADRHGVSIRTVYRDIRTLELSGVPVVTEEGKGYSIMDGYKLPPIMFTEDEANAIVTAEKLLSTSRDSSFTSVFQSVAEKIRAVLKNNQLTKAEMLQERIHIFSSIDQEATSEHLATIQQAVTNFRLLTIEYSAVDGKETKRDVEPFALINSQSNWLMIAYCRSRKGYRAFRLDRILTLIETNSIFDKHELSLQEYFSRYSKN